MSDTLVLANRLAFFEATAAGWDLAHAGLASLWQRMEEQPDDIWRMRFELAVSEVMANIVKHARAPSIVLQLSVRERCVTAEFSDTGRAWAGILRPPLRP